MMAPAYDGTDIVSDDGTGTCADDGHGLRMEPLDRLLGRPHEGVRSPEDEVVVLECGCDHPDARVLQGTGGHEAASRRPVGDDDVDVHVAQGVHRGDDGVRAGVHHDGHW